jgi:hypothetical protein
MACDGCDGHKALGREKMDRAVIERALRALAEIGAARTAAPELSREMPEPADLKHANPINAESSTATADLCGSADCAGCYNVGDGRKIHPPKIGEDYKKWLERWKPKGSVQ